jgi:hypothetical protein
MFVRDRQNRKPKQHGQRPAESKTPPPSPPATPHWLPPGVNLQEFDADFRRRAVETIQPAYEEIVAGAGSAMERSVGVTLVTILWLELLAQHRLAGDFAASDLVHCLQSELPKSHLEYLRLVNTKLRLEKHLLQLRADRRKAEEAGPSTPVSAASPYLAAIAKLSGMLPPQQGEPAKKREQPESTESRVRSSEQADIFGESETARPGSTIVNRSPITASTPRPLNAACGGKGSGEVLMSRLREAGVFGSADVGSGVR